MVAARSLDLEQARRLERAMISVRWFGVAFGLFQVWQSRGATPEPPGAVTARGFVLAVTLLIGNVVVLVFTARAREVSRLRTIGLGAFCLDIAVCTGFIWDYSFTWRDNTWILGYILPLEGALRFQLRGALTAAALFAGSESLREIYLAATLRHYHPELSSVTFRAGVGVIIATVAGVMARSLAKEADKAQDRALHAEESARREGAARREVDLFHAAVLAGVSAEDLDDSLQSMAEAIGQKLGFEVCTILLSTDVDDGLRPVGVYGVPPSVREKTVHAGQGLIGTVFGTGRPLLARDVHALADHVELDPRVRAKAAAPLRADGEVIGVLDVETWGQFQEPEATLDLLSELDRMKSDFVAITSHELRTPLTAIRGFVKTMMRNADRLTPADMQDFLQIVDRQSHRLARLVEDLLMASKIEAGELSIAPEPVAPVSFLGNLLASFGENADRIKLQMNGDAPDMVVVDPYRVEQILRNLLHNAMKFSPPGSDIILDINDFDQTTRGPWEWDVKRMTASIVLASRINSAHPGVGYGYELDAIAASVIGGASLMGGRGSVSGAIIGAIIMATIRFGLNVLGMSPFLQQIAVGAILIAAVFLDNLRLKHEARISKARFHR